VELPFDARCNYLRYDHIRRVPPPASDLVIVFHARENRNQHFSFFYTCNEVCKLICINARIIRVVEFGSVVFVKATDIGKAKKAPREAGLLVLQ
jgi:hypothetical protein